MDTTLFVDTKTPHDRALGNAVATPTDAVTRKVGASAVGTAVGVIVAWLVRTYVPLPAAGVPDAVLEAIVTLIMATLCGFLAGYFRPPGAAEAVLPQPGGGALSARRTA